MTKYIEKYEVPGDSFYGIEDYLDGQPMKDHFFGYKFDKDRDPRYLLWRGGCGIGTAETINEARGKLFRFIRDRINQKHKCLIKQTDEISGVVGQLGDDPFNLGEFRVHHFGWERKRA